MDVTWKDYVDAQDAATRAQNDARFAEVISKIDGLDTKIGGLTRRIDDLPKPASLLQIAGVTLTTALAVAGLIASLLAFSGGRFEAGLSLGPLLQEIEARQEARDAEQDARFQTILDRIEELGTN